MVAFADLIGSGYFPRELPPIFTTLPLATSLAGSTPLPQGARPSSHLLPFSLGRIGTVRRQLAIPNPAGFAQLAFQVSANWSAINAHLAKNKLSITSPTPGKSAGRAVDPRFRLEAIPVRRAVTRAGSKYLVNADISRFYSSIYTHTIPWATHGKAVAKQQRRNRALYGNLLDECVRKCQDDQTIGIPIGPDTSLIIAELLLSKVDARLRGLASEVNAFRYIDDYEVSCKSFREAEETLSALDDAVRVYGLELNHAKSRIIELPTPLYETWKDALAKFTFSAKTPSEDREELVRYFTTAFDLAARHSEAYVINYALSRLPIASSRPSSWRLIESLVLQCLRLEAGATRYVIAVLVEADALKRRLNRDRIAAAMSAHVEEHARLGHTSEVAWALWGSVELKLAVSEGAASAISEMEDAIVALLALQAKHRGIIARGMRTALWRPHMCQDSLYGPMWRLAYEAHVQRWLPDFGGVDYITNDPFFGPLKRNNVSFLDITPVHGVPRLRVGVGRSAQALYP